MSSLILMGALVIAGQLSGSTSLRTSDSDAIAGTRSGKALQGFHDFQAAISDLLKREAQAKDPAAKAAAIREMCALHGRIVADPRFGTSDTLKQYRSRLWSRLTKVKAELKQKLAREGGEDAALENAAAWESADAASAAATESLATSLSLFDGAQGGPGQLLAYGGRAAEEASGRALVELIERTINPAFWDTAGGPGTIMYYAPLQCLVVRATSEVHGNIGGLVGGLRKAGP